VAAEQDDPLDFHLPQLLRRERRGGQADSHDGG
jgi:hypothetical protein